METGGCSKVGRRNCHHLVAMERTLREARGSRATTMGWCSGQWARCLMAQNHQGNPPRIVRRRTAPPLQRTSVPRQAAVGRRLPQARGSEAPATMASDGARSNGVGCSRARVRQPRATKTHTFATRAWQTHDDRRLVEGSQQVHSETRRATAVTVATDTAEHRRSVKNLRFALQRPPLVATRKSRSMRDDACYAKLR